MLRVGVTGGIGSGKSMVCDVFAQLGIHIYNADAETKKLYATNEQLRAEIMKKFGAEIFTGVELNKKLLSQIVFSDANQLQILNGIVHPFVFENYENWCLHFSNEKYTIKEAAILFESGSYKHLHFIVGVTAPDEIRISRTMARDSISRDEVMLRIQKQMPVNELIKRCDFIIENDGEKSLFEQVLALHRTFLTLASEELPEFKK